MGSICRSGIMHTNILCYLKKALLTPSSAFCGPMSVFPTIPSQIMIPPPSCCRLLLVGTYLSCKKTSVCSTISAIYINPKYYISWDSTSVNPAYRTIMHWLVMMFPLLVLIHVGLSQLCC